MCCLSSFLCNKACALFLIGVALGGVGWGAFQLSKPHSAPSADVSAAKDEGEAPGSKAKKRSDHPPIAAIRDRVLTEFHGAATDVFTAIPGFGMERMTPLYKKIPFEVPYFSTGEVEAAEGPAQTPAILQQALAKTRAEFDRLSPANDRKNSPNDLPFAKPDAWGQNFDGSVARGVQIRLLDLVGLTDRDAPKVYVGGSAFELVRLQPDELNKLSEQAKDIGGDVNLFGFYGKNLDPKAAEKIGIRRHGHGNVVEGKAPPAPLPTRPLDLFESAGVQELAQGKDVYIRSKGEVVRMLGALRATEQCLKCHTEAKQGDLLGAFSYVFVDSGRNLFKAEKK